MKTETGPELISPCGMNCAICSGYLSYKNDVKNGSVKSSVKKGSCEKSVDTKHSGFNEAFVLAFREL